MKTSLLIVLAAIAGVAGFAAYPAAAPAQQKATAARDWTKTVVRTPEGGFRMGSPNAPVKLVEYGSMTCDHCAAFSKAGMPELRQQIRSGKLSFEFRNFVLNPFDLSASLISRCAPADRYFGLIEAMFQTQEQWLGRFSGLTEAQMAEVQALPREQQMGRVAALGGLDSLAAKHGVAAPEAKACLSNPAAVTKIVDMRKAAAEQYEVVGTPTFLVNGAKVNAHDWRSLQPLLKPAGG